MFTEATLLFRSMANTMQDLSLPVYQKHLATLRSIRDCIQQRRDFNVTMGVCDSVFWSYYVLNGSFCFPAADEAENARDCQIRPDEGENCPARQVTNRRINPSAATKGRARRATKSDRVVADEQAAHHASRSAEVIDPATELEDHSSSVEQPNPTTGEADHAQSAEKDRIDEAASAEREVQSNGEPQTSRKRKLEDDLSRLKLPTVKRGPGRPRITRKLDHYKKIPKTFNSLPEKEKKLSIRQ